MMSEYQRHCRESLKAPSVFSKGLKGKPKIFFIFGFDGIGNSVLIRKQELKMFSNRILKTDVVEEDKSDKEDENPTQFITPSYLH
jgi:hypothetical protein